LKIHYLRVNFCINADLRCGSVCVTVGCTTGGGCICVTTGSGVTEANTSGSTKTGATDVDTMGCSITTGLTTGVEILGVTTVL
jgi:hypothetical protein